MIITYKREAEKDSNKFKSHVILQKKTMEAMRFKYFVHVHTTIKLQNKNSYLVLYTLESYAN